MLFAKLHIENLTTRTEGQAVLGLGLLFKIKDSKGRNGQIQILGRKGKSVDIPRKFFAKHIPAGFVTKSKTCSRKSLLHFGCPKVRIEYAFDGTFSNSAIATDDFECAGTIGIVHKTWVDLGQETKISIVHIGALGLGREQTPLIGQMVESHLRLEGTFGEITVSCVLFRDQPSFLSSWQIRPIVHNVVYALELGRQRLLKLLAEFLGELAETVLHFHVPAH